MKANRTLILNALLIVILLVSCYTPSDTGSTPSVTDTDSTPTPTPTDSYSSEQIVGTPIRFGNIEVAQNIFPTKMFWDDAVKACANLGNGWRLPHKYELNLLYLNKDNLSGFGCNVYWSCTVDDGDGAWSQYFVNGTQSFDYFHWNDENFVRAVRTF